MDVDSSIDSGVIIEALKVLGVIVVSASGGAAAAARWLFRDRHRIKAAKAVENLDLARTELELLTGQYRTLLIEQRTEFEGRLKAMRSEAESRQNLWTDLRSRLENQTAKLKEQYEEATRINLELRQALARCEATCRRISEGHSLINELSAGTDGRVVIVGPRIDGTGIRIQAFGRWAPNGKIFEGDDLAEALKLASEAQQESERK